MKLIHFIRTKSDVTVACQEHLMREYACWQRIEDDTDTVLKMLRTKRAVVVAHIGLLAPVGPELTELVERIHRKGGHVIEGVTGRESHYGPDAFAMGINAMKRKTMTSEKAKAIATRFPDEKFKAMLPRWKAGDNRELMAREIGCSLATLQRRMHAIGAEKRAPGRRG